MQANRGIFGLDDQRRVLLDRNWWQQAPSFHSTVFWSPASIPRQIAIPQPVRFTAFSGNERIGTSAAQASANPAEPLRPRSISLPTQPLSPTIQEALGGLAALSQSVSHVAKETDMVEVPATPTLETAAQELSVLNTAEDIARVQALFQKTRQKQTRRVEDSSSDEWLPEEESSESEAQSGYEASEVAEAENSSIQEPLRHVYSKEEALVLGKNLKLLRNHHRLSREVVSREIRCDASLIWDVEQGHSRASQVYPLLETFYKVPFSKLVLPDFEKEMEKSPPPLPDISNPRVIQRLKIGYTKEEAILIGKNLRLLRVHHKLLQATVAAAIGCDDTMISHIEKGRYPKSQLYPKFEEVYQLPLQKLLSETFACELQTAPLPRIVPASVQEMPEPSFSAKKARYLGENLRLLRVHHNVSQPAIAEEIDATTNMIRYIEQGKACTSKFYPALEKLYGIALDKLLVKMSPEDIAKLSPPPLVLSKSHLYESFAQDAGAYFYSAEEAALLGKNLRVLRKHHKFPKASVAREIQCSKATFARIEKGTLVKSTFYKTLEKVFKISMQELLVEGFEERIKEMPPPAVTLADAQFQKTKTQERQRSLWPVIGKNIMALREHSDITYHRLAKLVERDPKTIKRYEEGKSTIDPDVLQTIATLFQVSIDDLEDETLLQRIKKKKVAPIDLSGLLAKKQKTARS